MSYPMFETTSTATGALAAPMLALLATLALLWTAPLAAQQGQITGLVTNAATGQPISSAQVFIPELSMGALSASNGRFVMLGVNAGTHTVRVERIGFAAATMEVTVAVDQTAEANFELQEVALNLDEIVVTGTGAPTQRRRLGQTITSVTADELAIAPITQPLRRAGGTTRRGPRSDLGRSDRRGQRDHAPRHLEHQPAAKPSHHVDGVRLDNALEDAQSATSDRLQDINPQDIDRVEVIRGAAAATLYGTEASKRRDPDLHQAVGQTGAPVYAFSTDLQHLSFPRAFPDNCGYNASEHQLLCDSPWDANAVLGYHQNYNLSVRGGTPGLRYYLSGRLMEERNPSPNNELANQSVRASFDFTHTEKLNQPGRRQRGAAQAEDRDPRLGRPLRQPDAGESAAGHRDQSPRGLHAPPGQPHHGEFPGVGEHHAQRLAGLPVGGGPHLHPSVGAQLHRLARSASSSPRAWLRKPSPGRQAGEELEVRHHDAGLQHPLETQISDALVGNLTVGGQSFREVQAYGRVGACARGSGRLRSRPSAGAPRSRAWPRATRRSSTQASSSVPDRARRPALPDRRRARRRNSAFGEDFGLQVYPKAGVSWVVSEYDFWNVGWMNELRLRAALGPPASSPAPSTPSAPGAPAPASLAAT